MESVRDETTATNPSVSIYGVMVGDWFVWVGQAGDIRKRANEHRRHFGSDALIVILDYASNVYEATVREREMIGFLKSCGHPLENKLLTRNRPQQMGLGVDAS